MVKSNQKLGVVDCIGPLQLKKNQTQSPGPNSQGFFIERNTGDQLLCDRSKSKSKGNSFVSKTLRNIRGREGPAAGSPVLHQSPQTKMMA
jgi:hypothetical protein